MGMREYSRAASVLGKDQQSPAAVFFRRLNVGTWWNDKWVIKEPILTGALKGTWKIHYLDDSSDSNLVGSRYPVATLASFGGKKIETGHLIT